MNDQNADSVWSGWPYVGDVIRALGGDESTDIADLPQATEEDMGPEMWAAYQKLKAQVHGSDGAAS